MLNAIEPDTAEKGTRSASEMFNELFGHLTPHTVYSFNLFGIDWNITNHTIVMLEGAFLVFLLFFVGHTMRNLRSGAAPRGRAPNVIESLVGFICEEMIYPIMGREHGRRFAPLFLTQFFFIWSVNLIANMPFPGVFGGAPTSNIAVTAALATTTFVVMIACGVKASGVLGMWADLVPRGVPFPINVILAIVEVVGFFIKPFALTIRLFANIFGGHLVVLSLFGLIYVFNSWAVFGMVLPMAIFVGILELLVSFLQAFIFTFLSIMFVQGSLHPEH